MWRILDMWQILDFLLYLAADLRVKGEGIFWFLLHNASDPVTEPKIELMMYWIRCTL